MSKIAKTLDSNAYTINTKKLISHLHNFPHSLFLDKVGIVIDQLYEDTYVQYLKETQQEKDNLIELLHSK